jgi:hypothetical protein
MEELMKNEDESLHRCQRLRRRDQVSAQRMVFPKLLDGAVG